MTGRDFTLSIVIPVYNGAKTIGELVAALAALSIKGGHEIVLVNDGSRDNSLAVCRDLLRKCPVPLTVVDLARNFGEQLAGRFGDVQLAGQGITKQELLFAESYEFFSRATERVQNLVNQAGTIMWNHPQSITRFVSQAAPLQIQFVMTHLLAGTRFVQADILQQGRRKWISFGKRRRANIRRCGNMAVGRTGRGIQR